MPGIDEWATDICLDGGCEAACTICWSLPPGTDAACYAGCLELCVSSAGCAMIDWTFSLYDP